MNKRIRQLAKEARLLTGWPTGEIELEKFAKLIVLECGNAVMDGTKEGDHYAMRIENHFDSGNGGILYFGDKK